MVLCQDCAAASFTYCELTEKCQLDWCPVSASFVVVVVSKDQRTAAMWPKVSTLNIIVSHKLSLRDTKYECKKKSMKSSLSTSLRCNCGQTKVTKLATLLAASSPRLECFKHLETLCWKRSLHFKVCLFCHFFPPLGAGRTAHCTESWHVYHYTNLLFLCICCCLRVVV